MSGEKSNMANDAVYRQPCKRRKALSNEVPIYEEEDAQRFNASPTGHRTDLPSTSRECLNEPPEDTNNEEDIVYIVDSSPESPEKETVHIVDSSPESTKGESVNILESAKSVFGEIPFIDLPAYEDISPADVREDDFSQTFQSLLNTSPLNESYKEHIIGHLKDLQVKYLPDHDYMRNQPDLSHDLRNEILDWQGYVSKVFNFSYYTLFLAVNIMDRYLSTRVIDDAQFRLLGQSSLLVAAKYEEVKPPSLATFASHCNAEPRQIVEMETDILQELNFSISNPTLYNFLMNFLTTEECSEEVYCFSSFLAELTLYESQIFLRHHPSATASAVIACARTTMGFDMWPKKLEEFTGHTLTSIVPVYHEIHTIYENSSDPKYSRIRIKFRNCL